PALAVEVVAGEHGFLPARPGVAGGRGRRQYTRAAGAGGASPGPKAPPPGTRYGGANPAGGVGCATTLARNLPLGRCLGGGTGRGGLAAPGGRGTLAPPSLSRFLHGRLERLGPLHALGPRRPVQRRLTALPRPRPRRVGRA